MLLFIDVLASLPDDQNLEHNASLSPTFKGQDVAMIYLNLGLQSLHITEKRKCDSADYVDHVTRKRMRRDVTDNGKRDCTDKRKRSTDCVGHVTCKRMRHNVTEKGDRDCTDSVSRERMRHDATDKRKHDCIDYVDNVSRKRTRHNVFVSSDSTVRFSSDSAVCSTGCSTSSSAGCLVTTLTPSSADCLVTSLSSDSTDCSTSSVAGCPVTPLTPSPANYSEDFESSLLSSTDVKKQMIDELCVLTAPSRVGATRLEVNHVHGRSLDELVVMNRGQKTSIPTTSDTDSAPHHLCFGRCGCLSCAATVTTQQEELDKMLMPPPPPR